MHFHNGLHIAWPVQGMYQATKKSIRQQRIIPMKPLYGENRLQNEIMNIYTNFYQNTAKSSLFIPKLDASDKY